MVRVAVVDDHQPFRERLRALLQRDRQLEVVPDVSSGSALLALAAVTDIDAVCMDIRLPGMSGVETTRRLLAMTPAVRVIGLSAYADPHYVEAMLDAGAVGHFTKGDVGEALLRAIHEATAAAPRFGAGTLVPGGVGPLPAVSGAASGFSSLRPKEIEILELIGQGLPGARIASVLSLEPPLLDVYRRNMMRKLSLPDDRALLACARTWSSAVRR